MPVLPLVATIIAAPEAALSDASLARLWRALPAYTESRWLEKGVAADLVFAGDDLPTARALAEAWAAEHGCDAIVQPLTTRRKRLIVADMDSTLIGQECIDELAERHGVGAEIAEITERSMRGELDFETSFRARVARLAGLAESVIGEVLATRVTLNPGARTLAATMRAHGGYVAILSGGFTPFTAEVARRIGADEHRSNRLDFVDGKLTGRLIEPVLGPDAKRAALQELAQRLDLTPALTMAVGDGANDLPMLSAAGLGVSYRGKPKVAAAADARIERTDLTALLYAQGYERAEWSEGG